MEDREEFISFTMKYGGRGEQVGHRSYALLDDV